MFARRFFKTEWIMKDTTSYHYAIYAHINKLLCIGRFFNIAINNQNSIRRNVVFEFNNI